MLGMGWEVSSQDVGSVAEVWLSVGYGHLLEAPLWGCVEILVYQSLQEARFGAGTQELADLG